jgi:hypothetical protein
VERVQNTGEGCIAALKVALPTYISQLTCIFHYTDEVMD